MKFHRHIPGLALTACLLVNTALAQTRLRTQYDDPPFEEDKAEASKIETPKVEVPKAEAPKAETPKVVSPKAEAQLPERDPEPGPPQGAASFAAALSDHSGHMPLVKFTVINDAFETPRVYCAPASWLLGALHIEHGLGYDAAGQARALEVALGSNQHRYYINRNDALDNLPRWYDDMKLLVEARAAVQPIPDDALTSTQNRDALHGLYVDRPPHYRYALGCALIERGLSPYISESGELLLRK